MIIDNHFDQRLSEVHQMCNKLSTRANALMFEVGSDAQLDFISSQRPTIIDVAERMAFLNDYIEDHFPSTKGEGVEMKEKLWLRYDASSAFLSKLPENIMPAVSANLKDEVDQFAEFIEDIDRYVISHYC